MTASEVRQEKVTCTKITPVRLPVQVEAGELRRKRRILFLHCLGPVATLSLKVSNVSATAFFFSLHLNTLKVGQHVHLHHENFILYFEILYVL